MVQYFVDAKLEFDASYIYEDVNRAIQHVHRSGLVHQGILSDPHKYLLKNVSLKYFTYFSLFVFMNVFNRYQDWWGGGGVYSTEKS